MTPLPVIYDPYRGTRPAGRSLEVEIAVKLKPARAAAFTRSGSNRWAISGPTNAGAGRMVSRIPR
jgi:hypothetical protein